MYVCMCSYVAIGTHDLDTVQPPFRYKAVAPSAIHFVPLTEDHGKCKTLYIHSYILTYMYIHIYHR